MATEIYLPSMLASDGVTVTPSDSTVVNYCGLYVGVTGDVSVRGRSNITIIFKAVPAGTILPINVNRVMAATTASQIIGFVAP